MNLSRANFQGAWQIPSRWLRRFNNPEPPREPRIGVSLSCGGARGLAHVGVIQVLEEENIPVSSIIGSSMGAYVGALWAAGIGGRRLEELAAEIKDRRTLLRLIDPVYPPLSGILRGNKLRKHLERTLGDTTIRELRTPMRIIATDLESLSGEILPEDLSVAAAIQASCAIPGICAPVALNGHRYTDGGSAQPLPVRLLRQHDQVDLVIAVNVMPTLADVAASLRETPPFVPKSAWRALRRGLNAHLNFFAEGNVLDTFKRCLLSAQLRLITDESHSADVVIHPFLSNSRWYDYENFNRYIEAGRQATLEALPRIRALMAAPVSTKTDYETLPILSSVGCGSA